MFLKNICFVVLVIFLGGCGHNRYDSLCYIENDNYKKNYQYYLQNFNVKSHIYKLITIFDDKNSYDVTKKIISNMKVKYLNKYIIFIVIFCPTTLSKEQNINDLFNYIGDLYNFLNTEKNYNNKIYVLGVPSLDLDKYKVIIYFRNM